MTATAEGAGAETAEGAPAGGRGWRFVLLAQPMVQAVRFSAKLVLAWFLATADFGQVMLAGLVVSGFSQLAILGLDEGLIAAPRASRALLAQLARVHRRSGAALAAVTALCGAAALAWSAQPLLGWFLVALAPMVLLANFSVLPTARLVRAQRFRDVFLLDLWGVIGLSVTTVGLAAAGCGAWSLVGGWYANAVLTVGLARRFARALPAPAGPAAADLAPEAARDAAQDTAATLRFGRELTGTTLLSFLAERLDSVAVGFLLGAVALGLYEFALHIAQIAGNTMQSLAERGLFPVLAARHRAQALADAYAESLRMAGTCALPLHGLLAALAVPLVATLTPREWLDAGPLLVVLSMVAGVRCLELVPLTALKAAHQGRAVLRLGFLKLALLALALPIALAHGVLAVAWAVLAARVLGALATLAAVHAVHPGTRSLAVLRTGLLWAALFAPAAWLLAERWGPASPLLLLVQPALALLVWALVRLGTDRDALGRDLSFLRARFVGGSLA